MDQLWINQGSTMEQLWINHGSIMDQIGINSRWIFWNLTLERWNIGDISLIEPLDPEMAVEVR